MSWDWLDLSDACSRHVPWPYRTTPVLALQHTWGIAIGQGRAALPAGKSLGDEVGSGVCTLST